MTGDAITETLDADAVEAPAEAAAGGEETPYAGLKLLAVDDEKIYIDTYRKYFGKRGFQVDVADNLSDFEQKLRAVHHHVVLLDYYLDNDKIEGDVMMQMVEQYDRDASVLVVTGRPSLDAAVVSLRKHVFDYLSKPIKIDLLAEAVNRALEAKGLLRMSANELHRAIGEKIREGRKSKGLTLAQLAERTGLSVGFLSQVELGKNSASIDTLYRIARALGTDVGGFFL
ncbi:MAG: response regulator [Planctomycetia bacterium]